MIVIVALCDVVRWISVMFVIVTAHCNQREAFASDLVGGSHITCRVAACHIYDGQ